MAELHSIFQENASPSAASAFTYSQSPTVGSTFARSGKLRAKACSSSSRLLLLLATIASVSAVAALVLFCSRVSQRHAFRELRSRRLSHADGKDTPFKICHGSTDEEDQLEQEDPHFPNSPAGRERQLPLKKRMLARAFETGISAEDRNPQQQEQQQRLSEPAVGHVGFAPTYTASSREQLHLSSLSVPATVPSTVVQNPPEVGATTEVLNASLLQHRTGNVDLGELQGRSLYGWKLQHPRPSAQVRWQPYSLQNPRQQQKQQSQLHEQDEGNELYMQDYHMRWQYLPWQQQHMQRSLVEQHQQSQVGEYSSLLQQREYQFLLQQRTQYETYKQQQHIYLQDMQWQQQPQQQSLIQRETQLQPFLQHPEGHQPLHQQRQHEYSLQQQEQRHSTKTQEQTLLQTNELQQVLQDHKMQQAVQQEGQQRKPHDEHELPREKTTSKWEQQGKLQPPVLQDEPSQYHLQPVEALMGSLTEDEWIAQDFPRPEPPQPSTSQQEFESSTAAGAGDPTLSGVKQVFHGPPLAHTGASRAHAAAVASRDEANVAPASAAAAASTGSGFEWSGAFPHSTAWTTAGGGSTGDGKMISSSLTDRNRTDAATAAGAGMAAGGAAGESTTIPPYAPLRAITMLLDMPRTVGGLLQHPFVRLPKVLVTRSLPFIKIDFERAIYSSRGPWSALTALQRAQEFLSQEVLDETQLVDLAQVAGDLVSNAIHYQRQNVAKHQTYRAVVRLGTRFLLLDAVVSTLIVLDQTPDPFHWREFTESIGHAAPQPIITANYPPRAGFTLYLAQELSRGMRILKRGTRPLPYDLVKIKRMLFCSYLSPARFRDPEFDPWRLEDRAPRDWS